MADGKLIFPVKFDLHSAVKEAQGDIDSVLRRLETQINSRPLKFKVDGGFTNLGVIGKIKDSMEAALGAQQMLAKDGSIKAMRTEMSALIMEWEKLSEKERTATDASGRFAGRAGEIVTRFAELTAAANTHARSLNQLMSAADRATKAEEKNMAAREKAAAKGHQMAAMLNAEETSLTAVAAKMKIYQEIANRHAFGSKEYQYATQQLERLGAQYERLKVIMNSNTGNGGKNIVNTENIKATLRGAENTIESVKAKLNALEQIMAKTPQDSFGFRRAQGEALRLLEVLKQLEANTPKSIAKENERIQKALIEEAAKRAEIYNKKRQQEAEDLAAQQRKAAEEARIKAESQARAQQENEARKRILNEQKLSYDTLTQKLQMLEAARNKTDIGAARWQRLTNEINKARESLKVITDEMDKVAKRSERLARLRDYGDEHAVHAGIVGEDAGIQHSVAETRIRFTGV